MLPKSTKQAQYANKDGTLRLIAARDATERTENVCSIRARTERPYSFRFGSGQSGAKLGPSGQET